MKELFAGPTTMEFGWELCCWQGLLRELRHTKYDKITVCSWADREPLYRDFADHFIPHDLVGKPDGCRMHAKPKEKKRAKKYQPKGMDVITCGADVFEKRRKGWVYPEEQRFIRYGRKSSREYDILIHARYRKDVRSKDNWEAERWEELCKDLGSFGRVGAIGTRDGAYLPENCTDLRNVPLDTLMDIIASARIVLGPSSGPMHLASFCCTPHMVWTATRRRFTKGSSVRRYRDVWNPFGTKVWIVGKTFHPPASLVLQEFKRAYRSLK